MLTAIDGFSSEQLKEVEGLASEAVKGRYFVPNPGPQTDAFFSEADEMFYGGGAGGGKSALLCGLAVDEHAKSLILRRENDQAKGIVEEVENITGLQKGWASQKKTFTVGKKKVEISGCQWEKDKEKFQGRAHDLKGFDEITHFTESQYRYIIGWNRTTDTVQRCRVVCTGNPPMAGSSGMWVVRYWAAWLDPTHPRPAKDGELRWFTTIAGEDVEVERGRDGFAYVNGVVVKDERGNKVRPRSRTFIQALLQDNPYQDNGYRATVEAMPEPLRSKLLYGDFNAEEDDHEQQAIPTAWITAAQARWFEGKRNRKMTVLGVDVASGGADRLACAPLYEDWFDKTVLKPGKEVKETAKKLAVVMPLLEDGAQVNIDMTGGWGDALRDRLQDNDIPVFEYVASSSGMGQARGSRMRYVNKRAQMVWEFREAL